MYCIEDATVERQPRFIAAFSPDAAMIVNTADGISHVVWQSQRHCWVLICCMHSPALSLVGPAQKIVTPWLSLFSSDYTTDITMDRPYSLHPQCLERRQNETYYKNSRVFPPVWALSEQAYKIIYRLIETTFDQRTAVEIRGVRLTWSGACVHLLWE